ncbi:unnamed protein product [Cochlearia groenlandica]
MPEGKLRSGVYRTFMMCDDPRGVVDCGAIKKQSKTCSTNQRLSHPRSEIAPMKSAEDAPLPPPPPSSSSSSSSLQLLRVSKGIKKLNVAIDSWSKGLSYESMRPEDIAKDLLRGALDLEESLAMLSSIQEDDDKIKKPRITKGDSRFQRSMSDRFGERVEKRMLSQENVASRDCYEELRKVIKESFLRQNLLPRIETKTRVFRSGFASTSGAASSSTSSSQSSMVSGSTKSSASSDIPRRAPSLVARLMGLDASPQEPRKSMVNHNDVKTIILNHSLEIQEQMKKDKQKEIHEIVRCNSTREDALQSLPKEIPSENPSSSNIVLIRPMHVEQPEMEEKPVNRRPVLPKKPRMQGEVHPRMMINQRKDLQAMDVNKGRSNNKMKLPLSLTKKEPKERLRKVEDRQGKVIKPMSPTPSNAKVVTKQRKSIDKTNKKPTVKKEDIGEGKDKCRPHDRSLKPPNNLAAHKKPNNSSEMSRSNSRRSKLSSSSSSSEQKSRPNAKKKLHQKDNDLASENSSCSSQDTRNSSSLNQFSTEKTTSSEFQIQDHCDNEEVTSSASTIQHCDEPKPSQISLNSFLSNSSEFLAYAKTLFDFNTDTKRSRESAFRNKEDTISISDQSLALDFAKEVARRKSLVLHVKQSCNGRSYVDIDELLKEVCDGFESLTSYRDMFLGQNSSFVKESIDMVLEKDLECKKTEMTSGVWDLSWVRSEFQIDETHQVIVDLEKFILSSLIQEIIS